MGPMTAREDKLHSRAATMRDRWPAICKDPGGWQLLHWRAHGLQDYVFDTQDLSVIRGASMMLDLVGLHFEDVLKKAGAPTGDNCLIVFASAGQAEVLLRAPHEAAQVGEKICEYLAAPDIGVPSSFVARPLAPDDCQDSTKLRASMDVELRLVRMSKLELDPGTVGTGTKPAQIPFIDGAGVDPIDRTRAVDWELGRVYRRAAPDGRTMYVSRANANRFRLGQQWRFGLAEQLVAISTPENAKLRDNYKTELDPWLNLARTYVKPSVRPWPRSMIFQQDFSAIGQRSGLSGYMGVVHGDGNSFSEYRRQFKTLDQVATASVLMDAALSRTLAAALDRLLREMVRASKEIDDADGEWSPSDDRVVQIAQLLYQAGDEFLVCIPADSAFQVASAFLHAWPETVTKLETDPAFAVLTAGDEKRLSSFTFSLAVVVAHADSPFRHLLEAAGELLRSAKDYAKALRVARGKSVAVIDWEILKSHDLHADGILGHRARTRYVGSQPLTRRPLTASEFGAHLALARDLDVADFPMRPLKEFAGRFALVDMKELPEVAPEELSDDASSAARRLKGRGYLPDAESIHPSRRAEELLRFLNSSVEQPAPGWVDIAEMMDVVRAEKRGGEEPKKLSAGGAV